MKKKELASADRYSGAPPGTSDAMGRSSGSVSSARRSVASHHGSPTSAASVLGHVTVLNDMPPNASRISATVGDASEVDSFPAPSPDSFPSPSPSSPFSPTRNRTRMHAVTMAISSSRL